jgi:hypothetical protein
MICPNCEYEYVDTVLTCPDCGVKLVSKSDFDGHLVHHSDWVVVYTTNENYKAEMYKANLEGAEIESLILGQKDRNYPTVGDLSVIKILVKKDDAETALEIIEDINSRKDESEEE